MSRSRVELIYLLNDAAELEHSLCCLYLFAAFSLKRDIAEGVTWTQLNAINEWEQTIFLVARQEMEHMGLVNNLLTALGGAPSFHRSKFPQPARYFPFALTLERFDEATIKRFVCFERPDNIRPEDAFCEDQPLTLHLTDITPKPVPYKTVGELYQIIRSGIETCSIPDRELFIGPLDAQVGGDELFLNFPRLGCGGQITYLNVLLA